MSNRFKYTLNGATYVRNVRDHILQGDFEKTPIGSAGGLDRWYLKVTIKETYGESTIFPFISCNGLPKCQLFVFFKYIGKDGLPIHTTKGRTVLKVRQGVTGYRIKIEELLKEENGYLDESGGLSIEYGIHVLSTLGDDAIWRFNFHDKLFDSEKEYYTIYIEDSNNFYSHKQLFNFHFGSKIQELELPGGTSREFMEELLQLLHGVQLTLSVEECERYIRLSSAFGFKNVIHYCEWKLIRQLDIISCKHSGWIEFAIEKNMRHFLANSLRKMDSAEELKTILEDVDIQKTSGESMKMFSKFLFDFLN